MAACFEKRYVDGPPNQRVDFQVAMRTMLAVQAIATCGVSDDERFRPMS